MEGYRSASIWVIEDVTEARKGEIAIQQANERLEIAQEAGKVGVFDIDLVADTVVWSDKLVSMLGLPAGTQPMGLGYWLDRLHPDDREEASAHFRASLEGGDTDLRNSWRIVRPDGEVRWFLLAARILRDDAGRAVRVVGVSVDIQDQKQLEEQVEEQLGFQQALIDAIPVPLFYKGADGRYIGFNRAYEQAFGVRRSDLVGKTVLDLDFLPPEQRTRFQGDNLQAMNGLDSVHREVDLPYADGRVHHTLFWLHAFARADGSPGGAIGTFVDITDRRRAEEEIRHLNADLERRVVERTRELERSNADLEQFAYVASHDLQEPLRMVTSYGQLLVRRHGERLDAEAHEFLDFIVDGGRRAQALVGDLLGLARVSSQAQPFEPVPLGAVLAQALRGLRLAVDESQAVVTHDEPLPTVHGDRRQLVQLLHNLLANALKFRGDTPPRVHVGASRVGGRWRIRVTDNGIGIAPQHHGRVFVMFQRLHPREAHGGTGIGLAICKKVVERHGGRIGVESAPGQGSAFWFTLPDAPVPAAAASEARS